MPEGLQPCWVSPCSVWAMPDVTGPGWGQQGLPGGRSSMLTGSLSANSLLGMGGGEGGQAGRINRLQIACSAMSRVLAVLAWTVFLVLAPLLCAVP